MGSSKPISCEIQTQDSAQIVWLVRAGSGVSAHIKNHVRAELVPRGIVFPRS